MVVGSAEYEFKVWPWKVVVERGESPGEVRTSFPRIDEVDITAIQFAEKYVLTPDLILMMWPEHYNPPTTEVGQ